MANDCEDGNGLRCGFLKKGQDVSFLKIQFGSKIFEIFAVRTFFKKLLLII